MAGAFGDLRLILANFRDLQFGEGGAQQRLGVQVRGERRPAGAVFELLRGIALQQQPAPGLQAAHDVRKQSLSHRRYGELHEDRGDTIVRCLRPRIGVAIRDGKIHAHPLRGRKAAGLGDTHFGDVEGVHRQAAAGEPDAVAALAVRDAQDALTGLPDGGAVAKPVVRRGTEQVVLVGEAPVPSHCRVGEWGWGRGAHVRVEGRSKIPSLTREVLGAVALIGAAKLRALAAKATQLCVSREENPTDRLRSRAKALLALAFEITGNRPAPFAAFPKQEFARQTKAIQTDKIIAGRASRRLHREALRRAASGEVYEKPGPGVFCRGFRCPRATAWIGGVCLWRPGASLDVEARKTINAALILLASIPRQTIRPFGVGPTYETVALPDILVTRNRVPAGIADAVQAGANHRPDTGIFRKPTA